MLQKSKGTTKPFDPSIKPSFVMFIIGQDDSGLSQLVKDISRSMMICEYDLFNQLTAAKAGPEVAYYTYNGDELRVKKNVNG